MSMEDLIMRKMKQKFGDYNNGRYSWVDQAKRSNVGTVYFLDDDLANHGSFTYDFQHDSFTIRFFSAGANPVNAVGFDPEGSLGTVYGKYNDLPKAMTKVSDMFEKVFK